MKERIYDALVTRSWWVFLFIGACYVLYSHGTQKKNRDVAELKERLYDLELKRQCVLEVKEDLELQIRSQSDPEWIQMTLMKGLGVVPEGQTKVYFKKDES